MELINQVIIALCGLLMEVQQQMLQWQKLLILLGKIRSIPLMSRLRYFQPPPHRVLWLTQPDSKQGHTSMLSLREIFHPDSIKWVSLDATTKAIRLTANTKAKEELHSLPELICITIRPTDTTSLSLESKDHHHFKIIKKCILH